MIVTAAQMVIPRFAAQNVVTGPTVENVISATADQSICSLQPCDQAAAG